MRNTLKRISRKAFFKQFAVILSLPFVYLTFKTVQWQKQSQSIKEIRVPIDLGKDVVFQENFIYIKQNNEVRFFSSKCTHLGCKINTLKNDHLACGCHGSHFSLKGKVLNGPALINLKELQYTVDKESQEYIIKLS